MIFGPNETSQRNLFFEKCSKERNERKDFEKFENFSKNFRSFRSFEMFSRNKVRRDSFGPKIVEIEAIIVICRPFEDFYWFG